MYPKTVLILLGFGLAGFLFTAYNRLTLLLAAAPARKLGHPFKRLGKVFLYAIGQKKFFKHGQLSGVMHAFIFWGFLAVALKSIILFGQGISQDFGSEFLASKAGHFYQAFKNIFQVLVVVGCSAMLFRRLVLKTKRLTLSLDADLILLAIIALMLTDFMMEWNVLYNLAYFTHITLILAFLNWLPYGKHFHVITSLPNVFLQKLEPGGALSPLDLENEKLATFGVEKINEFNWKQFLDLYTCTECGRCTDQCPAYATDKPLSPKQLTIDLRDHLYGKSDAFKESWTIPANGKSLQDKTLPELINNVVKPETIWACTTCKACEEACPVFIEYVDKIVDMRRNLVLMKGEVSKEAQTALKNMESNYNPWGIGYASRGDWAKDLNVKTLAEDKNAEYLYFVGCAGSFDERAKKVSRAFVKLLQKANVSFGILGTEEKCTGDSARRLGNEYLFQMLAKDNIQMFKKYGVKKIITTCPHCFNTLKNEYPQFGGNYEVHHHSEFLLELIKSGRLSLRAIAKQSLAGTITYHDSCYLGRYNNIYDAPREILKHAGYDIHEPKESRDVGRCCGAGGGWMWMEEKLGTRINKKRLEDLKNTGSEKFATACPFCLTMISDAVRDTHSKEETLDIAEILADQMESTS